MSRRLCGLPYVVACLTLAAVLPSVSRGDGPPPGKKYALLVGVHQYDKNELRDLPYAEADMEALADVLRQAGYKRVVLMTQSEGAKEARFLPLAANVRKTLKGLLEDLGADESVLVAFAGHGVQFAGEDDNYFCPMDAKLADKSTLVSLTEVYKDLEHCAAGTRLLLADCCRNDPRSDNARSVDRIKLESVTRPQRALPPGGVAAFFSCSAGEKAYEDAGIKHGVFFHFIIEGLRGQADQDGDGQVDLDELVSYTKRQVRDFVKETYGDDVRQMPELVGKTHGQVMVVRLGSPGSTGDIVNSMGMKLKLIKPGKFLMGSPKEEAGHFDNEGPQHPVEITKAFYMGACPVTVGQFAAFVKDDGYATDAEKEGNGWGYNASRKAIEFGKYSWRDPGFAQTQEHPAVNVSWNDAVKFCEWLSKKEGKVYELPTEAEWEYACRAGTTTRFWCGDADASLQGNANLGDLSLNEKYPNAKSNLGWDDGYAFTSPAGHYQANPWGLYDMSGNVFQWCADWYGPYKNESLIDPKGAKGGAARVLHGGSWYNGPLGCRSAYRYSLAPSGRSDDIGFRVVLRSPAKNP